MTMAITPNTACAVSSMKSRNRVAALAQRHQRKAEQDGEQQHLQDVAPREGADHAVGDDVQEEIDRLLRFCLLDVAWPPPPHPAVRSRSRAPDLDQVADDQADDQREGRDDLEIDQRLDADAADLLGILDMRNARDHRAEDDRRDHHLDQLDEAVAERLDPVIGREVRQLPADEDADHDRDQHLNVEYFVPGFRHARRRSGCDHCRHDAHSPLETRGFPAARADAPSHRIQPRSIEAAESMAPAPVRRVIG